MKKAIYITVIFSCIFLLTGCIKSETTMVINKDKSMDFSVTYLVADYMLNLSEDDSGTNTSEGVDEDSDAWKNLKKRGYTLKQYTEDEYTGFQAKKQIKNIDDISSEKDIEVLLTDFLEDDFKDDKYFKVEKGFFKNKYTANFVYDLEDETSDEDYDMSAYTSAISMQYKVTLPEKAIKNNATSVSDDGLTYTWKAPYGKITNISYTFEIPNISSYIICIAGGIIVAGAIFSVIIIKAKKSKKSDTKKEPKKEKK